jgi:hypothetical protein
MFRYSLIVFAILTGPWFAGCSTSPRIPGTGPSLLADNPEPTNATANRDLPPVPPPLDLTPAKQQATYGAPVTLGWRQQLDGAIAALEAEVAENPISANQQAKHARLRMLYAAAGRREDAACPIPAAPPAEQAFLAKELGGPATWLTMQGESNDRQRAAEVKPMFREAVRALATEAPLLIRNMAFCTEVVSYGCVKRFSEYEFQPNQELLLYAEIENFTSPRTVVGYQTSLQSRYEIVDAHGRLLTKHEFPPTEETCQNPRRDYFIGYRLRLPFDIKPGAYNLHLSIEDLKSGKVGQASIEFGVKKAEG